jgi:hypothetical protein
MKTLITILLLCTVNIGHTQNFKEKDLKTEIEEVTVFLNSAQIFESGSTTIPAGKTIFKIKNLPPFMDEKSIQVKAVGDFTILSVNHKLNYLTELKKDDKIDSLQKITEAIQENIIREEARLAVLSDKQSLLNANRNLGGESSGVTIVQLKQAIELYETEVQKIKEEELRINKSISLKKKEQSRLQNHLKELHEQSSLPSGEIEIRVSAETQINAKFKVTYLVANAGWYPKYDIRVKDIKNPLSITYKAEVFQNTGVDWKNVKLRFSNGNPNQSGLAPELATWNLGFARNIHFSPAIYGMAAGVTTSGSVKGRVVDTSGQPMPGVNVLIKGTTIGTSTDSQGHYNLSLPNGFSTLVFSFIGYQPHEVAVTQSEMNVSLSEDARELQEMVVTGYSTRQQPIRIRGIGSLSNNNKYKDAIQIIPTTTIENQTTVEIEVTTPYSIKSNGEKLLVDLKNIEVEALYQYYAIPKLDKDAFLMARIINWDQYNLLEGEANLYFEDAYVGRSILDAKSLQDTLDISLGRDKNIIVGREKNEQFSRKRTIGSNISESRGFKITVRNKKSQPIKLTLFDQLPVSVVSDIGVEAVELSKGTYDDKTGKVIWELTIDGQQQKELSLQYEVKYPKREKVLLE